MTLRIRPLHLALLVVVLGSLAWATSFSGIDAMPRWLKGGFWAGPASVQAVSTNKVTRVLGATVAFNFDGGQAGDVRWGPPVTMTGAQVNDFCEVSADFNALGTGQGDVYNCYVSATDTVLFSVTTTKNGNDPGDAGFFFRVFSNQ